MGKFDDREIFAKPSRFQAKRGLRAKHKRRMQQKAMQVFRYEKAFKIADHMKVCSSPWCCGNPRIWHGDSLAEVREKSRFSTDVRDWI